MQLFNFYAQDTSGNALSGASAYVYNTNTSVTVSIYDVNGNSITNPITTPINGLIEFRVSDGTYDVRVVSDSLDYRMPIVALDPTTGRYVADTGSANAYVAAYNPRVITFDDGMEVRFKAANANTGASTLTVNSLAAKPIIGLAQSALQGGEILAGSECTVVASVALDSYILKSSSGGGQQVADGTKTHHAASIQQLFSLKGSQKFTSSGSFTVPASVTTITVSGCAGGSGGGGSYATTSSNSGGGGGGGAGQSIQNEKYTVTPGQVISITIGAGGNGGAVGSAGSSGGNTVIGSLVTLAGGGAGQPGGTAGSTSAGGIGGSGYPYGGYGTDSGSSAGGGGGGQGASGPFGGGGSNGRGTGGAAIPGRDAYGYGSGGGGAGGVTQTVTGAGAAGGSGMPGFVFIEW